MESVPYFAFISGLTKRQPMVVSSSFAEREKALSALPRTKGARDMLSTPPAITSSASPDLMAREGGSNGVANVGGFHGRPQPWKDSNASVVINRSSKIENTN